MTTYYRLIKNICCCIGLFFIVLSCTKPEPKPQKPDPVRRKSPIAIAKTLYHPSNTYIKIVYGQPYKHDRPILGNLVPYDKVWRTGANEATELTTTGEILFAGKKIQPGTYTLFSVPHRDNPWIIILNSDLGQWGAFDYNQEKDVLRVDATAVKTEKPTEVLSITFSDIEGDSANISINWDHTKVTIPITFL